MNPFHGGCVGELRTCQNGSDINLATTNKNLTNLLLNSSCLVSSADYSRRRKIPARLVDCPTRSSSLSAHTIVVPRWVKAAVVSPGHSSMGGPAFTKSTSRPSFRHFWTAWSAISYSCWMWTVATSICVWRRDRRHKILKSCTHSQPRRQLVSTAQMSGVVHR